MKKIIVMGIPHHGNIGDNAIAIAEEKILQKYFPTYKIYYIQEKYLDICAKRVKKFINDEDIIFLHGGGNIGDTYERPEKGRREVIQLYPNNKIIIFPQTAYFSDTEKGKIELENSKNIYNSHHNLVIMAREVKSYNFMKEHFYHAKIYLTPDIVMSLHKKEDKKTRQGALLLFRTDKEKTLKDEYIEHIKEIALKEYGKYTLSDMNLGSGIVNIGGNLRKNILDNKFNEFQTSQIVITDRLHGMIFAAITETPCIVFGNFNHKISESYKWLQNLEYIKFCEDTANLNTEIQKLKNIKKLSYSNKFAEEAIINVIKEEVY